MIGVQTYHDQLGGLARAQVAEAEVRARMTERRAADAGIALDAASALVRDLRTLAEDLPSLIDRRAMHTGIAVGEAAARGEGCAMTTQHPHLQLVPPPTVVRINEASGPWWEAPEFLALAERRREMVGGGAPATPPQTAEESARHAMVWALFELEHIVRRFGMRIEAGDDVRMRSGVHKHEEWRVDFDIRVVEHVEIPGGPR